MVQKMRKMKDSGIEWIGEIPEGWETCLYKYCCSVQPGYPFDSAKFSNSSTDGFPLIRIRDITSGEIQTYYTGEYPPNYIVTAGDLLVGMDGDFNVRWWNNDAALLNQRCCRVTEKDSVLRRFLYYVLPFTLQHINTLTYATTVKHLANGDILNSFIAFPSLPAQQNIVHYLDIVCSEIDAMLSKTRSSIEEYKKLKQSVITQAVTKGVRGEREMKDSGVEWIGKVPSKWNCIKIKYLFEIRKRIAGKEGYTVLSITQTGIKPKNIFSNEGQLADSYSNYQLLHFGEFAMNHMDLLTGWVDISNYNGVTSPDYRVFSLKDTITNHPRYFLYLMQMCYFNRIFYSMAQGVSNLGRWRLQSDKFLNCIFPVPSIEEQKEISDYLDTTCSEIDKLIAKKEQLVKELESYKKSLIYEVVTGKREV